jgi:hypothetical protein
LAAFPDGDASKRMCDKVFIWMVFIGFKNMDTIKTNEPFKLFPGKNDYPILRWLFSIMS